MKLILILALWQLIVNIVLDKTGISKKYFLSSGGFVFVIFCGIWIACSLFISSDLFPDFFIGDFWFFTLWMPWLILLIVSPIASLIVQLLYSYLIRGIVTKK
jgi:hypothetical protein